jgi:hypothetical protein
LVFELFVLLEPHPRRQQIHLLLYKDAVQGHCGGGCRVHRLKGGG